MGGETNLTELLKNMQPHLQEGEYVFCTKTNLTGLDISRFVLLFKESEGFTLVMKKETADSLNLPYSGTFSWISLTVHSSLQAVGLTAAFSTALAKEGISCNVVAAYYHDHIFVETKNAEKALQILQELSKVR
jgi:uncharacterized protein